MRSMSAMKKIARSLSGQKILFCICYVSILSAKIVWLNFIKDKNGLQWAAINVENKTKLK
jgi:hypothetical protein